MKYNLLIKPKNYLKIILLLVLFTSIQSCIKDKFNFDRMAQVEYEPTLVAPVLHTKLTLWDVLYDWDSSHIFVQDQTHFLTLLYRGTIFSQTAEDLITIPNQYLPQVDTTFDKPNSPDTIVISLPLIFSSGNGEKLDEIYLKQGNFNIRLFSDLKDNADIVTVFQSITKISDGTPLTISNPNIGIGPHNTNNQINLTGYKIGLDHIPASSSINILNVTLKIKFHNNAACNGNGISLNTDVNNMRYSKLFGYFGQPSFVIREDSVFLDIFKRNLSGRFTLVDPKLNINVYNSYGFPINITFDKFSSYRSVAPLDSVPISGSGLPSPWSIISPTISQVGQTKTSTLNLNKTTCNIDDAINISPQFIVYHTSALGNPAGNVGQNFVLDTSKFKVDVDVELPIWGKAVDFTVQDTFKMEEFKLENRDKIDWAAVRVTSTNGFPVDVKLQLIFTDTLYNRIDSLFLVNDDNSIIASGILGPAPNYRVILPTIKRTETIMSGDRINYMIDHNVKKVLLKAILNTSNNHGTDVKFYSDYTIDLKVGVKTHVKVKY